MMGAHPDLEPAARRMARIVEGVPDDAIGLPTPCERYRVGDLLDHIGGSALAFTAAAVKRPLEGGPSATAPTSGQTGASASRCACRSSPRPGAIRPPGRARCLLTQDSVRVPSTATHLTYRVEGGPGG